MAPFAEHSMRWRNAMHRLHRLARALLPVAALAVAACAPTGNTSGPGQSTGGTTSDASLAEMLKLGRKSEAAGNVSAAADIYARAARQYPDAVKAHLGLGRTSYRLGKLDRAVKAYGTAADKRPKSIEARYGLGRALVADDRPKAAIREFNALIDQGADTHKPYLGKGVALDMLGRHTAAQTAYRAGLDRAPGNVPLRNNLGLSLALGGDPTAAIRTLNKLARDPTAPDRVKQNLALAYGLAGRMDKAEKTARTFLPAAKAERNLAYYKTLRRLHRKGRDIPRPARRPAEKPGDRAPTALAPEADKGTASQPGRIQTAAVPTASVAGDAASAATPDAAGPRTTKRSMNARAKLAVTPWPRPPGQRVWVQVASLQHADAARGAWNQLKAAAPEVVRGLPVRIASANVADLGTVHRVQVGPFAATAPAASLCDALKRRGHACLVRDAS